MPTLEVNDGFESGSLAAYGQTGTPTIVNSPVNSGSNSLQINGVTATEYIAWIPSPVGATISVGRLFFRFNTMPGVGTSVTIAVPRTNNALNFNMRVTTTGVLQVLWTGGSTVTVPTLAITTGQFYRLDWQADCTSSGGNMVGTCTVNDGATDFPLGSNATVAGVATTFGEERIGNNNATTADLYIDDLAISRLLGDYPIGALPTASGSHLLTMMGVGS